MSKLRVAILGASGIGKFHAREFHNAGCEVKAVLGSSEKTAIATARTLKNKFGIEVKPYHDLESLLAHEELDAVSICTPPEFHSFQAKRCLESGLHVLCEKPFVQDSESNNHPTAQQLIELANQKGLVLTINTQWVSILPKLKEHINLSQIDSFSMTMEPYLKGIGLITDSLPHMNAILFRLIPGGKAENIRFPVNEKDKINIEFDYKNQNGLCKVKYITRFKEKRPREFSFSINGINFRREIVESYRQELVYSRGRFKVEDPLKVSIQMFVSAVNSGKNPLVSGIEITENVKLQDLIIKKYMS